MKKIYWNPIRYLIITTLFLSLSGCDWVVFNSKGAVGIAERDLILLCIGLMLIVVLPAIVLSIIFPWKFRTSNKKAVYTPDWAHSTKLEIIVWGIPIIIIAILSVIVWKSTHALDPYRPLDVHGDPVHVQVIATDWKWVFVYPDLGIATINELHFPVNRPVAFEITSNSTMNTFFIPQLGGQIYAMAGMRTQLHLIANEQGKYRGLSGNYSGNGFSKMHFYATATSEEDFQSWVNKVRADENKVLDMATFQQIAQPTRGAPVTYFSKVEPALFKKVIDQFIGIGENTNAPVSSPSDSETQLRSK